MEIIADLHTHTIASDHGYSTIQEMCAEAARRKLKALAITDHAPGMVDSANSWHFGGMWIVPRFIEGVALLRGAELNVQDYEGTLDLDEHTIRSMDLVVASLHNYVLRPASRDENTALLEKLCRHDHIDVIGHPVKDFDFDYDYIAKLAADTGTALELKMCIRDSVWTGRSFAAGSESPGLIRRPLLRQSGRVSPAFVWAAAAHCLAGCVRADAGVRQVQKRDFSADTGAGRLGYPSWDIPGCVPGVAGRRRYRDDSNHESVDWP